VHCCFIFKLNKVEKCVSMEFTFVGKERNKKYLKLMFVIRSRQL
jgi:hypothetical protein